MPIPDSFESFELLLCTSEASLARAAFGAGVDAVIVEWEEIERASISTDFDVKKAALRSVRRAFDGHVIARLSEDPTRAEFEFNVAIELGADEIWLPKVRSIAFIQAAVRRAQGRCELGIVLETPEAIQFKTALQNLPLRHVHVGLIDLAESLNKRHPFESIADGTLEQIVTAVNQPFGFGGLTRPDFGHPIPCRLLMGEIARLKCSFSLLRKSFLADCGNHQLDAAVVEIRSAIQTARNRSLDAIEKDRRDLEDRIRQLIHPENIH